MIDWILSLTRLPNLHPAIVHFPIVLLPVALLFDLFGLRCERHHWLRRSATSLYLLAAVAALGTVWSGRLAAAGLVHVAARVQPEIVLHSDWGHYAAWTLGAVALLRLGLEWVESSRKSPVWPLRIAGASLAAVTLAILVRTADLGGGLVYQHGLGVSAQEPRPAVAAPLPEETTAMHPTHWKAEAGVLIWEPRQNGPSPLHAFLTPAAGSSLDALSIETDNSEPASPIRIGVTGTALALFPETFGDLQLDVDLDLSDFDGTVGLAHHVEDSDNARFFLVSWPERVARLTTRKGGTDTNLAEGLISSSTAGSLAVSVSGTHLKGLVDGAEVVHGHEPEEPPSRTGLLFEGTGVVEIRSVHLTPLTGH